MVTTTRSTPPLRIMEPTNDAPQRPTIPADLAAELERVGIATALDALRLSPWLVAATLRREIAGQTWDVTISCTYWRATSPDGSVEQEVRYHWAAAEPAFRLADDEDDEDDYPDDIVCRLAFGTPEEALADAERSLTRRAEGIEV